MQKYKVGTLLISKSELLGMIIDSNSYSWEYKVELYQKSGINHMWCSEAELSNNFTQL